MKLEEATKAKDLNVQQSMVGDGEHSELFYSPQEYPDVSLQEHNDQYCKNSKETVKGLQKSLQTAESSVNMSSIRGTGTKTLQSISSLHKTI
ncbi:hypothetical protein GDO78_022511 [Eleutherodactylus coqui]|uniref:Uncharacterized protein n=1 Tax=Eleutherodactylus coqui TaxID=57060 RepID=A0A8J6B9G4_ELECQ|nr:hypothetical protein GDO78_022511 [Eleutherodactylus coqui]